MQLDLPVIWAAIICLGVFIYVVLDGFDLGIGLLLPFVEDKDDRQVMLDTVAPVWDGNETFLVLGGAGLYAAFPIVYATLLPANYLPLILMVVGLIFRGAAFELRTKAIRTRQVWDLGFVAGSGLAAFCQGVVLGSLLQGIRIVDGRFAGGAFDWFSPFSVFCGMGVLVTYASLGCGWLILKTEGELQTMMRGLMRPLAGVLLGTIALVSLWTMLGNPAVAQRWLGSGRLYWFLPVPLLVIACVGGIFRAVRSKREMTPFLFTLALCFLGFSGLVISIWPCILPPALTIWQASSDPRSQSFALVGLAVMLPIILIYHAMQYRVFRGKVRAGDVSY